MPDSYYHPGGQRSTKVRLLFDTIARRYDLANDLQSLGLHRVWKRAMVRMAGGGEEALALDLCCGTGDIALALAQRGWRVLAIDFSLPMLRVAQARASRAKASREPVPGQGDAACLLPPQWILGDALSLSVQDNTIEVVTISYGLRNLGSIPVGLKEIRRVLRPGGRVVIQDFGKPSGPIWRAAYFAYLEGIVPCLGWLLCRDYHAYRYIRESLEDYPDPSGISAALVQAGFANVQVRNFLGGVTSIHVADKPG
jgi:demethylmenaquinone methyltransferase/2-methoxy-6-polyprenyl-1,4-benzoquinol methylase